MGISKVVLGEEVKLDLTSDTVTAETLLEGYTAHGADGEAITGTYKGGGGGADYFGDGSDGDVVISADTEIAVALDEGQIIKNYNSLTVNEGCTLKPANRCNGMVLLVKGDLVLNGTISVDKCAPLINSYEDTALSLKQIKLCGSLTGGKGGDGGTGINGSGTGATGGTGGAGYALGGGWPGGGGAFWAAEYSTHLSNNGADGDRAPIGTAMPYPAPTNFKVAAEYGAGGTVYKSSYYYGGAAPGGYGADSTSKSTASDGYPGGAVWVFVGGNVTIGSTGKISACGGNGGHTAATATASGGGGGGGGGGIIALVYGGGIAIDGSIRADGGNGGVSPLAVSKPAVAGSDGSAGAIFIHNISDLLS